MEKGISKGELNKVIQSAGIDSLIDEDSKEFKDRGMGYMEYDPVEEILEHPLILNTPIVRQGATAVVGEAPEQWKQLASAEK